MKVNSSSSNVIRLFQGDSQRKERNQDQNQKKDQEKKDEKQQASDPQVFEAQVTAAVHSFGMDLHAQSQGLKAETSGHGLGLKVVLKDGMGAVVRQLSGEEFLELRHAASSEDKKRGRLLDRKF